MKFHGFVNLSSVVLQKMSWSNLCFSSQLYENNFQALHKNFDCRSLPFPTWMDENV